MADVTVGVAGLGSVGLRVAQALDKGLPGLRLACVAASTPDRAARRVAGFRSKPVAVSLEGLPQRARIVVECLPPDLFPALAGPVLAAGGTLVVASVGGLLSHPEIRENPGSRGGRIVVPSGAVAGLDALAAAREAGLHSVRLVTRKPPSAFGEGFADHADAHCIFSGTATEAVARFPRNINVAATVSLAGLGPEATLVEIWADPTVSQNTHELFIRSEVGEVHVRSVNLPDPENPKSSAVTGHSIVAALRRMTDPLCLGT